MLGKNSFVLILRTRLNLLLKLHNGTNTTPSKNFPINIQTPVCTIKHHSLFCTSSAQNFARTRVATLNNKPFTTPGLEEKIDPSLQQLGIPREKMPQHVAAILDGNRRWAKANGKELDYTLFFQGYMKLADLCLKWRIGTLSCFAFSTENWKRSNDENGRLFDALKRFLEDSLEDFTRKGIKVIFIGDTTKLDQPLEDLIHQVQETTKSNSQLELIFAVSYGGKWDVVQAIRRISMKAKAGEISLNDVDYAELEEELSTKISRKPEPDLLIRTGGDRRISNFMLWQLWHTEFYFTEVYGPDFGEEEFVKALRLFEKSERRFGS